MEAEKSKLPHLPVDVITEILLRSPVKSVGRFRCLSKVFCSMLCDPKFARKQLELTLRRTNVVRSDNRRLIMSSLQKLFLVDLDSIDVERECSFRECLILLSKQTRNPRFKKMISSLTDDANWYNGWCTGLLGSSNGLVCVRCTHLNGDREDGFLLYNSTTRDSKIIPEMPESVHCKTHHQGFSAYMYELWFGFGFDALTNDYKLVELISYKENEHNKYTVCYVYSLKTDSWRRINNLLPYYSNVDVSSANLKGAIHWIARTEEGEDWKVQLMAFDLEKDELREMPLPNLADEFDEVWPFLIVDTFKGCLCVVHGYFLMHNIIWVMNEYGVESSWSKIRISVSDFSIKPLSLTKNDHEEVLLVYDGHLVYKNPIRPHEQMYEMIKASTYVESLISPNSW